MTAVVRSLVPWLVAVPLLGGLLMLARDSWILWILGVVAAGLCLLVSVLGTERAGRYLVVLGMLLAPMSALVVPGASFVTGADLVFALGFGLLLPTILGSRPSLPVLYWVGALALLLLGTVASIAAADMGLSFNLMARFVAGVIVMPLVFLVWRPATRTCVHLAQAYGLGVIVSIGYGVVANGERPGARFIGLTEHPNVLGITGLLGAALMPFVIAQVKPGHRWFWWGVLAVNAATVWFSGSRAALLVFVALAVVYPAVERSARIAGWMLGAGAVGILVYDQLNPGSDSALGRLMGGGSADASDAQREELLSHYWAQFLDSPLLGHGFAEALLGHNVYLQVAVCVGVFGVVAFAMILFSAVQPMFTAPRPLHRIAYAPIAYAMIAMITSVIWDRYIWAVLSVALVISAQRRHELGDDAPEPPEPSPSRQRGPEKSPRPRMEITT